MKIDSFFSNNIKKALKNNPPGEWMPELPEECIRLSSGYPDPALVPSQQIKEAVAKLIEEEQDLPLHYLGSPRIDLLKQQIQKRLHQRGMKVHERELLITSGACQALDLIARVIIDEESVVAVEAPTYMEALEIFQNYTKQIINIPVDENGLQTSLLEEVLKERTQKGLPLPRILYTIPTAQNPTGTTMDLERRKHLLKLAGEYDFLILEDDAYGELSFGDSPIPLKAIDTEGRVLHVGSLSKVVAPGMRIGWIAGSEEFISAFAWFKKDLDHPFAQASVASYLEEIDFEERLNMLKEIYRKKCDTLINALQIYFPESVTWYMPSGGYFVWVHIPGLDTSELLVRSLVKGVSFIPGEYFFLNPQDGTEFFRLSFCYEGEAEITEGIKRLGQLLTEQLKVNSSLLK
ncbi:aminotransferase [Bacillus sp. AFS076308]|uniref:aminotransferase-like domain-containing protein n=1 Tax=unclassified Bacillus (in: firmicutes) TaxID=185979 RepID=UPI000BF38D3A|nr:MULTISPECIES: PLP-dependent aminotransferase family protein [unclassified Bacillus (in: firmicutes)]PFN96901.1 aminotransferase [Bacillus sp. AFS076308]PGV48862.1 aminotransferase [Bacillus sp. AFS037270]